MDNPSLCGAVGRRAIITLSAAANEVAAGQAAHPPAY